MRRWVPMIVLFMAVLSYTTVAKADLIVFTPAGATDSAGDPVSAMADFSFSGTTLTITLTNTLPGIKDAGQLLTDIFFTVPGSPTLFSQTGDLISVATGKTVTDLGSATLGWAFGAATVNSISGFELCVICQGGAGPASATPSQGIIGPASGDGNYDNANGSIAKTGGPHNPFVNQTATFVLHDVPVGVTVGNVIFSFGTTPGDNVPAVPEPSSLLLFGSGLIGAAGIIRRKLRG